MLWNKDAKFTVEECTTSAGIIATVMLPNALISLNTVGNYNVYRLMSLKMKYIRPFFLGNVRSYNMVSIGVRMFFMGSFVSVWSFVKTFLPFMCLVLLFLYLGGDFK